MTCTLCGAIVPPDAIFCGECGAVVRAPDLAPPRDRGAGAAPGPPAPEPAVPGRAVPRSGAAPADSAAPPAAPPRDPLPAWLEAASAEFRSPRAELDLAPAEPDARAARGPRERFVLQFSTGESVTVSGSGLIGRNPVAQPGEYLDQFVVVGDPGKSVSKSHLEFGQDDGWFWVIDRWSTNGTVVRAPDAEPRRCEPGRRVRVPRGSRVEIGEQFFVVS